ncbi:MAG: hypothetical protein IKS31_10740 [Clostridia bacterium]|nr:hypothetical protein [Clostridia bacterium]
MVGSVLSVFPAMMASAAAMKWYWWFVLAVSALLASVAVWIHLTWNKQRRGRFGTPFYAFFAGVLVSATFLLIPIYAAQLSKVKEWRGLHVFVSALHHALQMFTIDADPDIALKTAACPSAFLSTLYSVLLSAGMIIAPMLTFTFVISFFRNLSSYLRYAVRFPTDAYVFSELNERSIVLAQSIKKNHRWATIVFTDVYDREEEASHDLAQKAQIIRAICFKKDILDINFRFHLTGRKLFFFTIGTDETENINQSVGIIKAYGNRKNCHLFVFSTRIESELILNATDKKGSIRVRRIDEVQSLIYQNLFTQVNRKGDAVPDVRHENIFERAGRINPTEDGEPVPITAVIIGTGQHGTEMIKALAWFCQMDGYRVRIHAFDQDEKAREKFTQLCPELMEESFNGKVIEGEAFCDIRIHNKVDVQSIEFVKEIKKIKDVSYVLVCLGTDEMNIRTAVTLRTAFEQTEERRGERQPIIQAIVYNSDEIGALESITNFSGNRYDIDFIGDLESSHAEEIIISSELQERGYKGHCAWARLSDDAYRQKFWDYEYYYRSSLAAAIHAQAMEACGIPECRREIVEKIRWNAYMRSEGFITSGSADKSSRNDLAKMHNDLVRYGVLNEEEKPKDRAVIGL